MVRQGDAKAEATVTPEVTAEKNTNENNACPVVVCEMCSRVLEGAFYKSPYVCMLISGNFNAQNMITWEKVFRPHG